MRLVMNLLLMKEGFPPAIILKIDRAKYYDGLNSANNGNYQKLTLLKAQALERTLNIYQDKIDAHKEGRNWFTTREAIEEYVKNRKRNR